MQNNRSLIDIKNFTTDEIQTLMTCADSIISNPRKYSAAAQGKKIATLFYEPSTRTRLSFEAAMLELGGTVIGFSEANSSSASKGESLADTARVISNYADIIAIRHPKEGAPLVMSQYASVPVINAGDGGHNHPTQTLADLYTIKRKFSRLDNLNIGLCGDLKFGRTVHSLICAMSRYENVKFTFISPKELCVPDYVKDTLPKTQYSETNTLYDTIKTLDVLYMTRVQKERFFNEADYIRLKDSFILTDKLMNEAKENMCVLHPLPRVNEISINVDCDPRALYFEQTLNGKYMREALILFLLNLL